MEHFLVSLVISVITAIVTVRLSLEQFRSERWWEKKTEAYSKIISELSIMFYCLSKWLDGAEGATNYSDEFISEFTNEYHASKINVEKVIAMGSYIISEKASTLLYDLQKELNWKSPQRDWHEELERAYTAVKTTISGLRVIAKKDLDLKSK